MANMLWEDTFYEDGLSIADRIAASVREVLKTKNGVGYGEWMRVDGWSEAIVDYILQYEAAQ